MARITKALFCSLAAALLIGCSDHKEEGEVRLPPQIGPWKLASTESYDASNLYDYMDGAAELYLSFGFRSLAVGRYVREGSGAIVAEIYRMDSSANAFGVFAHDRQQERDAGVGQDSEFEDGWLRFWKGPFYVSVYSENPQAEADSAVMQLGRTIAGLIPEEGNRPELLALLPADDRIAATVRYFHDPVAFNHYYFLSRENILGLCRETEGVLARYRGAEGGEAVLAVIRYPETMAAQEARERFYREYLGAEPEGGTVPTPNEKWACAEVKGSYLFLLLEGKPQEYGIKLLNQAMEGVL